MAPAERPLVDPQAVTRQEAVLHLAGRYAVGFDHEKADRPYNRDNDNYRDQNRAYSLSFHHLLVDQAVDRPEHAVEANLTVEESFVLVERDADKDDILDFILSKDIFLNFMKKKRSGRKKTKL